MQKKYQFKGNDIYVTTYGGYIYYSSEDGLDASKMDESYGKWIVGIGDAVRASAACFTTIIYGAVNVAKHTTDGKLCLFYTSGNDTESHIKVITYLLGKGLIPITKAGRLANIAFKLDSQTRAGQYGANSTSFHLSDFVNLDTGLFKGIDPKKQEILQTFIKEWRASHGQKN